jgi:hypothetical protein
MTAAKMAAALRWFMHQIVTLRGYPDPEKIVPFEGRNRWKDQIKAND